MDRFLILAREAHPAAERLVDMFSALGRAELVVDHPDGIHVWYPDEELVGFEGLMGASSDFPPYTAWSRALYHLTRTAGRHDQAVWFIEDDVAGSLPYFRELVVRTTEADPDLAAVEVFSEEQDPHWPNWHFARPWFVSPWRAFQPLCRLSSRLVAEVLAFGREHKRLGFHEVLFPSLAKLHGLRCTDWLRDPRFRNLLGEFRFRPSVENPVLGISHPVKREDIHLEFSQAEGPPAPSGRLRQLYSRIDRANLHGWSILGEDYAFLVEHCRRQGIRRVVEFGPGDSTLAFLDAGCEVLSFEHDVDRLKQHRKRFASETALTLRHCDEHSTPDAFDPGWEPDLVFVDGPPLRPGQTHSRLAVCEWAIQQTGYFILHDANRPQECATLAGMEGKGLLVVRIPSRKGLAIVVDPHRCPQWVPISIPGAAGWPATDLHAWWTWFHSPKPVKVLEVGAWDTAGATVMLDFLFPHASSEIDCWLAPEAGGATFSRDAGRRDDRVRTFRKTAGELELPLDGENRMFDFIHIVCRRDPKALLFDACRCWPRLRDGGTMVFSDSAGFPGNAPALGAFVSIVENEAERVMDGACLVLRKVDPL